MTTHTIDILSDPDLAPGLRSAQLAALDAAGIVASDQCMDCLGTADGLDSCITHAVIRELDQMHDSVRRYGDAIADPIRRVTWDHPGTSIVDVYRVAAKAGLLTPARLGADQAIANHYQLAVRWVYPLRGWTDDDLEIYEAAVRDTPAPAMLDEDLPNAALDWRSADQIANTARERVRRLVIAANTRGISKYRLGQLLDGLVSEPTIAKWCASERGTV